MRHLKSDEYNAFVCPRKTDYVSGFHKAYKGDSEFGSGTYPDQNYFINVQGSGFLLDHDNDS